MEFQGFCIKERHTINNKGFIPVCLLQKQWFCIYYSKSRKQFFKGPHFPKVSLFNDKYIVAQQLAQQEFTLPEEEEDDKSKSDSSHHTSSLGSEEDDDESPTNDIDQGI